MKNLMLACCVMTFIPAAGIQGAEMKGSAAVEIRRLVSQAGNTEDEGERYDLLQQLRELPGLPETLKADLERLMPVVDDWANGRQKNIIDYSRAAENGYLCRFITGRVRPAGEGELYPPALSKGSPLEPFWGLYRGRMLIWRVIQSGPLLRVPEQRNAFYMEGRRLLEQARQAFPDNRVIGMYLGEPIAWPRVIEPSSGAPEWANLQREGLEKLTDIIQWWIDERQLADGQFGGGWGDDVEMWRWWAPVLIGFEDEKIEAAQARISNGMFQLPHMEDGFTSRMTDVEHSNEDTTDTILPMMHVSPDDPVWSGRARTLAEYMKGRWTGRNEMGFLQFRSIYFSVDRVDTRPERAFDTVYHPSAVQPALLLWQRSADPELGSLFGEWLKVWIDAAADSRNGKPAGVLPSAIHWPDGAIGLEGRPWWEPFSPGHNDALYNWPGATRLMTSTLLLAYQMLGDEQYLAPIRSMAELRMRWIESSGREAAEPGSAAWAAERMGGFLPDVLAKYRFLTGDDQYDDLLSEDASGYVRYRLNGNSSALLRALERNAAAFRTNWEGYTDEMRWTDRVMSFTSNYLRYFPGAPPRPDVSILYSTATGDPGTPGVFPMNRVRWLTSAREIAAMVTDWGEDHLEAELYHFGNSPREMGAEFYLLKPGKYRLELRIAGADRTVFERDIEVTGARTTGGFRLPAGELCRLRMIRKDAP